MLNYLSVEQAFYEQEEDIVPLVIWVRMSTLHLSPSPCHIIKCYVNMLINNTICVYP